MDKKTEEAARRQAERLALRDLSDNIRRQNWILLYLSLVLTAVSVFGLWLYLKLDGMNILTRLIG